MRFPVISEGTDSYSLFRFFTVVMLFVICIVLVINVNETHVNRNRGYQNRSVACAVLKSQLIDKDVGSTDAFIVQVYHEQCETDPAIIERYPNAVR